MLEYTKKIKSIEAKSGGKSGTYWVVTWDDDKSDRIFNGDWLSLLEKAQEEGLQVHFAKEKQGQYYNIIELCPVAKSKPTETKPEPAKHDIAPQEKGMWFKEMGECFRSGLFKKDDYPGSYLWRVYVKQMLSSLEITIPKKEVQPAEKLVEEAKRLGAIEEEKGG